tara:strand:+ start:16646 stop:16942 length:297 start_codon:yes stop_codon:yes gene_type:complete
MSNPLVFTSEDKHKCQILDQGISIKDFDDRKLPTDVHIITYTVSGDTYYDAVRAYSMVDIFDCYYDKLNNHGSIVSINSGYGRIKPSLFGKIAPKIES